MKKNLIALLLAASMILSLAACGGKEPAEETAPEVETEETAPETEPAPETEAPDAEPETEETAPEAEENTPEVKPEEKPEQPAPEAKPEEKPEQPAPETKPEAEAPSAPAAGSVDLNAFYADIAAAQGENWPFMMPAEGEMLDAFFAGLSGIATKQCYAYLPAMSAVAAEVVLVEVENASDVDAVKAILQARIDAQVAGGAWYPETIEGWEKNSRIVTNGNFIMLAVYSDVDAIVSGFNALFA